MKLYSLEGSFVEGHPVGQQLKEALAAHHWYLKTGFDNGTILFSGPKAEGGGGVIVVKSDDIETFCQEDPFVQAGIQTYRVVEFKLFACQDLVKDWFS